MINKLTLNGITIEYPSGMTVAITGENIRLLPREVRLIEVAPPAATEPPPPVDTPAPAPPPAPHTPAVRLMPKHPPAASKPPAKPLTPSRSVLPPDWKDIVFTTLRQNGGSAYARRLSMRVFKGVAKLSYSQATQLRRELRAMVDRGELVALGSSEGHVAQALYGLPAGDGSNSSSQPSRMHAAG